MNNDLKIYNIINKIGAEPRKNSKIDILQKEVVGSDIETDFLRIVTATYNPYINFYIKSLPVLSDEGTASITDVKSLEVLRVISTRELTGHKALYALTALGNSLTWPSQLILSMIIDKSLNCGISLKTINKVWPGKIPEFNVMLCHPLNDKTVTKLKFPVYAQIKYDAARVTIIVKDNKVKYFTRNGKEYLINNKILDNQFLTMSGKLEDASTNADNMVYDGELFKAGAERVESNAVTTKFVRGTASKEDNENIKIVLWDAIDFDDFVAGKSTTQYKHRLQFLTIVHKSRLRYSPALQDRDLITIADTRTFDNIEDIREHNYDIISQGLEGIIVKNMDGMWEAKRSTDTLKMKEELESELLVIGVEEGKGKYKGKCGALTCVSSDGLVKVSVGTGLSDAQRSEWSPSNAAVITNKIITVRHNGIIHDVTGKYSLYLPRLIEVRFDKTVADDLYKIQNEGKTL